MFNKKNKIINAIDGIIYLILTIMAVTILVAEALNIPKAGIDIFEYSEVKLTLGIFLLYYLVTYLLETDKLK